MATRRLGALCLGLIAVLVAQHCSKEPTDTDSGSAVSPRNEEPQITVRVDTDPPKVQPGRRAHFYISILRQPEGRPAAFSEDEADPVHFVIVRSDLGTFTHLHPQRQSDGRFAAETALPTEGTYWLFTYFRAAGAEPASVRSELRIGTRGTPPKPLTLTPRERRFGAFDVTLVTAPEPPSSYEWTSIKFHVMRGGKPVGRVEPTGGHLVILPESGNPFVFAHSTLGEAAGGMRAILHAPALPEGIGPEHDVPRTLGPDVQFHTRFPRPGRYRIWGEFTVGADRIVADFVVNVI